GLEGRAVPRHRPDTTDRRARHGHRAKRGRVARALQPVPLRQEPEQAVLQRDALVRELSRPGAAVGPGADAVRVVGWLPGAPADDADLLREVRARGAATVTTLRIDVARPSRAGGGLAERGLRRSRLLQRAVRRLHAHDQPAPEQGVERGATRALGAAAL